MRASLRVIATIVGLFAREIERIDGRWLQVTDRKEC